MNDYEELSRAIDTLRNRAQLAEDLAYWLNLERHGSGEISEHAWTVARAVNAGAA